MSDFNNQLRRYIDGLEEPVSLDEAMNRRADRRFRVPAAVLAGAAVVLIPALVLVGLRWLPGGNDAAETTTSLATTTSLETTTSLLPIAPIAVPDLIGLTEAQARSLLGDLGLQLEIVDEYPSRSGFGLIKAQGPQAGDPAEPGSTVVVEVRIEANCLNYESPGDAESDTIELLFECANSSGYPGEWVVIARALDAGEPRLAGTVTALLAGPNPQERSDGVQSFFDENSAGALNAISLGPDGYLVVDFNDAIIINNASTTTGGMFFMAELQANLFQFPDVQSIEFRLDGSCEAFGEWMQIGECPTWTREDWEELVAAWDAERALQPGPGEALGIDDIVGATFTTQVRNNSPEIMTVRDGDVTDLFSSGFSEIGGWLLDDANTDDLKNWALHVTGQNAEMIWLVESIGRTDQGSMIYTVRAVLEIPWREIEEVMQGDPFVRDGASACTRDGVSDPRLVVVAEVSETDGVISDYMNPLLAWLINVDSAQFVEIPVDGVECLFEVP